MGQGRLTAYFDGQEILKVHGKPQYDFAKGDFSGSCLFSVDEPGVLISNIRNGNLCIDGWYIEIQNDSSILFYTGNGYEYMQVYSKPLNIVGDGMIYYLAFQRKNGELSLALERMELELVKETSTSESIDLAVVNDLCFGAMVKDGFLHKGFVGTIQDITLWKDAIINDAYHIYLENGIMPDKEENLVGWWSLDGTIDDDSNYNNGVYYANDLSFWEVAEDLTAVTKDGYHYGCITNNSVEYEQVNGKICPRSEKREKEKQSYIVNIDKKGIFFGTCNKKGALIGYPDGVEVNITSPSGMKLADMKDSDNQAIRTHNGNVFQFLLLEPEKGLWEIEVYSNPDSKFDFDFQYIPENMSCRDMDAVMYTLYPECRDKRRLDVRYYLGFRFDSIAKILALDLELTKETRNNKQEIENTKTGPLLIGIAALIATALVIIVTRSKDETEDFVDGYYHSVKDDSLFTYYNWMTFSKEMEAAYKYKPVHRFLLSMLYEDICLGFEKKVPQDPKNFYTRIKLMQFRKKFPNVILHLDLGGEGYFKSKYGIWGGFPTAININTQYYNSQYKEAEIPFLIPISDWNASFPFETGMVDRITAQGTPPFTEKERDEIARCIRKDAGGKIDIWTREESIKDFGLKDIVSLITNKYELPDIYVARIEEKATDTEFHYSDKVPGFYKYSIVIEVGRSK